MPTPPIPPIAIHHLGLCDYADIWRRMQTFTRARTAADPDQIWLLQHPPIFTTGARAFAADIPRATDGIPLLRTDRGGRIAYHAPGQLIAYLLLDLKRRQLGPRALVQRIEASVIRLLAAHGITAARIPGAPGVYVAGAKIAALGLRVRGGCTYHGLSLNVAMDLGPYRLIHPCGERGLAVTQMLAHRANMEVGEVEFQLAEYLVAGLV